MSSREDSDSKETRGTSTLSCGAVQQCIISESCLPVSQLQYPKSRLKVVGLDTKHPGRIPALKSQSHPEFSQYFCCLGKYLVCNTCCQQTEVTKLHSRCFCPIYSRENGCSEDRDSLRPGILGCIDSTLQLPPGMKAMEAQNYMETHTHAHVHTLTGSHTCICLHLVLQH